MSLIIKPLIVSVHFLWYSSTFCLTLSAVSDLWKPLEHVFSSSRMEEGRISSKEG